MKFLQNLCRNYLISFSSSNLINGDFSFTNFAICNPQNRDEDRDSII